MKLIIFSYKVWWYIWIWVSYEKHLQIGHFKLTSAIIKWIVLLDSKSNFNLKKKEIVNIGYKVYLILGK
jgi:hypothetical protein